MKFRPCIDIHNGRVKQIVGGSLKDAGDTAKENFVAGYPATYYAELYKDLELDGGHIILLNGKGSEYYEKTRAETGVLFSNRRRLAFILILEKP